MANNNLESLIKYAEQIQYNKPDSKNDLFRKKKGNELDEEDPISLKSYLDTILPPKETAAMGEILMAFVSCTPATTNEVIQLAQTLNSHMHKKGARETGICSSREELYSECLDELIRQITINCLQRGELLNHIKEQMKDTINYYQKLYESSMAFAMRKVLREQKKRKKLEMREHNLQNEIDNLKRLIREKEKEIDETIKNDEEQIKTAMDDHEDMVKTLKNDNNQKTDKIKEILTTPKQMIIGKK